MKTNVNLIEGKKKNNTEKNNYSVNGFLWNERQLDNNEVVILKNELGLETCIAKLAVSRGINSKNFKIFQPDFIKIAI